MGSGRCASMRAAVRFRGRIWGHIWGVRRIRFSIMAKNAQQRQHALERKKKKKRSNALKQTRAAMQAPLQVMNGWPSSTATRWPVMECVVSTFWDDSESLATVIVARRRQEGKGPIAMALFLIDLQCLGGKDGFAVVLDPSKYRSTRAEAMRYQGTTTISLDLAAKIVRTGIAYARDLGFAPHRDVTKALPMLYGAHPENCDDPVPVGGADGRPLFIAGPNDNVATITSVLNRNVAQPQFEFIAGAERHAD